MNEIITGAKADFTMEYLLERLRNAPKGTLKIFCEQYGVEYNAMKQKIYRYRKSKGNTEVTDIEYHKLVAFLINKKMKQKRETGVCDPRLEKWLTGEATNKRTRLVMDTIDFINDYLRDIKR